MNINFIAMGKLKESWFREACAEYLKRLGAYVNVKVIEPAPVDLPQKPSQAQIDQALRQEAVKIREQIKPGSFTVAMCIEGKQLASRDFAKLFNQKAVEGYSSICLIIGSSHGLSEKVKARRDLRMSFSKMTFPHQLFRLMALEQIYRAFSINAGTKYHK